jgi:hypothetical protein
MLKYTKEESYEIIHDALLNPPTTQSGLYSFLTALTGEFIPFEKVCEDHFTPWDYIWHSYRVDLPKWEHLAHRNVVYIGPRAGYKTLSVAKLIAAELLLKPNCSVAGVGAIQMHSKRTYQYVMQYLKHPAVLDLEMINKTLIERTELTNGSVYSQATATLAGMNSLHPQKLRTEENDMMKEEILEEGKMIPSSYAGLKANMSYVSTRKFEGGIMDELVNNSIGKDFEIIISCYKDTAENCPVSRRGTLPKQYKVENLFVPGTEIVVNAYEGCKNCPLLKTCRGDLARANGIVKIDDLINEFNTLDPETWIWQKECKKTRSSNTFFIYYDDIKNVGHYPYRKSLGWADMSFDFSQGGEDPTVVGFWQTDEQGNDYLVKEMVFYKQLVKDVADAVLTYIRENGVKLRHQWGDSSNPMWINELNTYNPEVFRIRPTQKIQRRDGWGVLKARIRDNNGVRHLFVDESCKLFRSEATNARKSNADPFDIGKKQSDHSLDQARYRAVELYWHENGGEPNIRFIGGSEEKQEGSKEVVPETGYHYIPRYLEDDDDEEN